MGRFGSVVCNQLTVLANNIHHPAIKIANGYIDTTSVVEFFDDFIGSNGTTDSTVPGYPWSTNGSDAGFSIVSVPQPGGAWELKINGDNKQVNLFGGGSGSDGGSFLLSDNKDLHFKARFRRTHAGEHDHGFFIGLTSHTSADLIDDNCGSYISGAHSSYGLLLLKTTNGSKYSVVAHNNSAEIDGSSQVGLKWSDADALTSRAGAAGYATGDNHGWITFEMNIHWRKGSSGIFKISYNLTDEHNHTETGSSPFGLHSISGTKDNDCCKSTSQKPLAPAISIKDGDGASTSYEVDYIHCVQHR